ncbi:Fc.00g069750.m01.CDS01 [Cosmosporella sp. VM-42]
MDRSRPGLRPHRGRGSNRNATSSQPGLKTFPKGETMKTAKYMMDTSRQQARRAEDEEYMGPPPADPSLIQAVLVLPGKHLLPRGLDEPGALNDIRRSYQVYITRVDDKPNVLDVRCKSISGLQKAVKAINWAIHDLRLSNDHPAVRFLLQEPTNAASEGNIRIEMGKRPYYLVKSSTIANNASAMDMHVPRLAVDLRIAAETLMALTKHMKMRVTFGQLILRQKKRNSQDVLTKDGFAKLLNAHSVRGGAGLETRLPDTRLAEEILRHLLDPELGICRDDSEVSYRTEITLALPGKEIAAEIRTINGRPQLSSPRTIVPEAWGRLNWTIAAPDMEYDWSFRVDAWEKVADLPPGFSGLPQRLSLSAPRVEGNGQPELLKFPRIQAWLGDLESHVDQIRMTTAATIPYMDTPYVVEVNVGRVWKGGRTTAEPEMSWGIELYAVHWEESINYVSTGGRKKDWGEGLQNIWAGDDPSLEARFGDFLRTVLEVQALLEDIDSRITLE